MLKKTLFIVPFFLFLSFLLIKCKKEDQTFNSANFNSISSNYPLFSSLADASEQLRWIARGYAEVLHLNDPTLIDFLDPHLMSLPYLTDAHESLEAQVLLNLSLNLEYEIFYSVDRIPFHTNEYVRDVFYGFHFDACDFVTTLSIVDTNNRSLPMRITYNNFEDDPEVWGYFWNNNALDSTLLTESNFEDYFVLLIDAFSMCENNYKNKLGCNDNCICEPLHGETPENCDDCRKPNANCPLTPSPTATNLKIVWVRINNDIGIKDEAWVQNCYNLYWQFVISRTDYADFTNIRAENTLDWYADWTRKQIPSIVGRRRKGTLTQKTYRNDGIQTMWTEFEPYEHDIYIRFHEGDPNGTITRDFVISHSTGNELIFPSSAPPLGFPPFNPDWFRQEKGGSFHGGGFDPAGGIILIPANSNWASQSIGGAPHRVMEVTSPNGEVTAKFAYEE